LSSTSSEPPPRRGGFVLALGFLAAVLVVSIAYSQFLGMKNGTGKKIDAIAQVPPFELTNEDGKPFGSADLKGKIWVANFIFADCKGPCPLMTARMAELQGQVAKAKADDVRLISFTVDPENDTPAVLKEYATNIRANPDLWHFLTGTPEAIRAIVMKGLLQSFAPGGPDGPIHSTRFVVVDRNGTLRTYHDGTDPEIVQKLLMDIGALMRERPEKNPS